MAELKGCGEERWRQSGEWEQLPVSCSWINCASYNATTKGDGGGFTEVSKCHWEGELTAVIRCLLLIQNQRMVKGCEKGAGSEEETAPHLRCWIPHYRMSWMLEACFSSVQHRRNSQRRFHRGLLNTEEVLESQITGDSRVFVREPAYAIFL